MRELRNTGEQGQCFRITQCGLVAHGKTHHRHGRGDQCRGQPGLALPYGRDVVREVVAILGVEGDRPGVIRLQVEESRGDGGDRQDRGGRRLR